MPTEKYSNRFTLEEFEGIGKALCISLLDIIDKNPISRIKNTPFRNITRMRLWVASNTIRLSPFKKDNVLKKIGQ